MPSRPPRACSHSRCKGYSSDGSSYCDKHKPEPKTGWFAHRDKHGSSRHKAGYGSDWDKIRERILIRDRHLCQACLPLSVCTQATHVDHIINKANGGTNSSSNLQSLCYECHKRKTQEEAALAKRLKRSNRLLMT